MKCVHIIIRGVVQGIFYRSNTKKCADELNLCGWVQNKDHDKVEILAQGNEKDIKEFIHFCRSGHDLAKIENICITEITCQEGLPDFNIV